jgi:hypothetical protein
VTDDGATAKGRRPSRRRAKGPTPADQPTVPPPDLPTADEPVALDGASEPVVETGAAAIEVADDPAVYAAPVSFLWSRHPESRPWLSVIDDRSLHAWVCPFLRAVDVEDQVLAPIETPDVANRCAALSDPVPQSLRQQELVCLTSGHVNCPRYLRGAVGLNEVESTVREGRSLRPAVVLPGRPSVSPAILASLGVLVVAFFASVSFVVARGGLELSAAATPGPSSGGVAAVASATPSAEASPVAATPTPTAPPTPSPSAPPTPAPTPPPTPTPTPARTPQPTPEPTPSPEPTSARYALLEACPNEPRCWIYTVRRGDNLFSIANYFGVSLEAVYARNPWTRTENLRAGQELRLPPPTR